MFIIIAHKDKGYGAAVMTNSDNGGQSEQRVIASMK